MTLASTAAATALGRILPPTPPQLTLPDLVALQQHRQQQLFKTMRGSTPPAAAIDQNYEGRSAGVHEPSKPAPEGSSSTPGTDAAALQLQLVSSEQQAAEQATMQDSNPIAQVGFDGCWMSESTAYNVFGLKGKALLVVIDE